MANGQLGFVADIPGAVQRGLQFRQAEQLRPGELQQQQLGLQRQQQQLTTGGLQQQAIQQGIDQRTDDQKNLSLATGALGLLQQSDDAIVPFLEQRLAGLPQGADSTNTQQALELARTGNFNEIRTSAKNIVDTATRQGILKAGPITKPEAGFTLSPGQQRFGPGGELIAEVAPRAAERAAAAEQAVIPPVLLTGLDPEIAESGAAAFTAAGGGKDGLAAFQKIVDKGTEQQRRIASPQILQSSFPQASPAETVQLQAAMDAAKTTESGLKAAGKVREEQRRNVKGKKFQVRAIELLEGILFAKDDEGNFITDELGQKIDNPELGDVLGSIEGVIDFRLQDSEAQLIADIEESGNILTAGNLSLMSGVLSETDIKILANLAGGALIRTRSESRFRNDVTKLRDKLAAELILTVDDQAATRAGVAQQAIPTAIPTAPPSGRQGGVLNTDAQGNRAFIFPDGTFEEVQ